MGLLFGVIFLGLVVMTACRSREAIPSTKDGQDLIKEDFELTAHQRLPLRVAVFPLKNLDPQSASSWLAPTLTELIASDLSQWPHLKVISRQALGSVLREQWYQSQGFHSEDGVRPGRLQGARYIIQGGCLEQDDQLTVNLQVIDVETGVVQGMVRVEGTVQEFPILEQSLVRQLVARLSFSTGNPSHSLEKDTAEHEPPEIPGRALGEKGSEIPSDFPVLPSLYQEDVLLSLENLTRQRLEIMKVGQVFFNNGLTIEMGPPRYHMMEPKGTLRARVPMVVIPLSIFVEPNRVREVVTSQVSPGLASRLIMTGGEISVQEGDVSGQGRLLVEQLLLPRRLFVRARKPSGIVMAVFSRPEWRTDRVISSKHGGLALMPMWPKPLLTGLAEFPAHWLEPDETELRFDAVFVPASRETLDVAVEWVDSGEKNTESETIQKEKENIRLELEQWLRRRWTPSITETLPLKDYLPGNKREGQLFVHAEKGIITQAHIRGATSDPFFGRSLENLQGALLNVCPWCFPDGGSPESLPSGTFRVQCTLIKDISALSLGEASP